MSINSKRVYRCTITLNVLPPKSCPKNHSSGRTTLSWVCTCIAIYLRVLIKSRSDPIQNKAERIQDGTVVAKRTLTLSGHKAHVDTPSDSSNTTDEISSLDGLHKDEIDQADKRPQFPSGDKD